jgi:hypothetical protein
MTARCNIPEQCLNCGTPNPGHSLLCPACTAEFDNDPIGWVEEGEQEDIHPEHNGMPEARP